MSRRGMRTIVAVMLFLTRTVEICRAQAVPAGAPGQPLRLTLKQAVQLALRQNPQVLVARLLTMESGQQQQIARAGLLPQANLTAATALEQYNFQSIERLPKPMAAGPYQWIEAGPTFSQSVLNLPLIRNYQIGREGVRESRAQERVTREDITASVVLQYHLVLRAIAIRDAAKARVALAERLSNLAVNQQKTGVGLLIDTTRAQVELQNERQNLIDAETEVHTTLYVLEELLDLPPDREVEAADALAFYELPTYDTTATIAKALATRPEMRSIESQQNIAELSRKSASEQRIAASGIFGTLVVPGRTLQRRDSRLQLLAGAGDSAVHGR